MLDPRDVILGAAFVRGGASGPAGEGAVIDATLSIKGAAADAAETGGRIEAAASALAQKLEDIPLGSLSQELRGLLSVDYLLPQRLVIGSVNSSTGEDTESASHIRARAAGFLCAVPCRLRLEIDDRYGLGIQRIWYSYGADGTQKDYSTTWTADNWISPYADRLYKMIFRKADNTTITDEELAQMNECIRVVDVEAEQRVLAGYASMPERVAAAETRLARLEKDEGLPAYYDSYLQSKIAQIRAALADNGGADKAVFFHISDQHYPGNAGWAAQLMKRINAACGIDVCVNTGDLISEQVGDKAGALDLLMEAGRRLYEANAVYLPVAGNHDDNCNAGHSDANRVLADAIRAQEQYHYLYKTPCTRAGVTFGPTGKYYYWDDTARKVRYVVTDCSDGDTYEALDEATGTVRARPYDVSPAQLHWLIHTALDVPDGWTVLGFSHIPYASNSYINTALATTWDLTRNIFDGFKNHTDGGWAMDGVDCRYDFTASGAAFAGFFCGHIHADEIITKQSYTVDAILCDSYSASSPVRAMGSVEEHAFDVVIVDTAAHTVQTIRIGSGSDRAFSY